MALKMAISLIIGALLLWLAFARVHVDELVSVLRHLSLAWIGLALLAYYAALGLRTVRWWLIQRRTVGLSLGRVGQALLAGYAVNILLPARLGEIFRADFCRRQFGVSRTKMLGTIMVERFTDGIVVLVALGFGLLSLQLDQNAAGTFYSVVAVGTLVFVALGAALYILSSGIAERFTRRLPALSARFAALSSSVSMIRSPVMLAVLAASVIVWLADGMALWAVLAACGAAVDIEGMCLVIGVVSLSTLLPSPPGFLGTMQFAFTLATVALGYSSAQGLAAATVNQGFLLGSMVVVGLAVLATSYGWRFWRENRLPPSIS